MPVDASSETDSVGARLGRARLRLGLTIEQVAEKLRLDPQTVTALESGHYQVIGAVVFVRGFLRRYAELVGESSGEIEALFAQRPDSELRPDLAKTGMHRIEPDAHGVKLGARPALIAVAVLAIAGAVWWAIHAKPRSDHSNVAMVVEQTQVTSVGTAVPAPAQPPAAAALPTDAVVPVVRRRHLQVTFSGESWAEIYDARGVRLFFGFGHAGTTQDLNGAPPFRLVLGNAGGVAVAIEGVPVALPPAVAGERTRVWLKSNGAVASAQ